MFLVLGAAALSGPPASANYPVQYGALTVSGQAQAGRPVQISGSGYSPGATVTVRLSTGAVVGTATADATGSFSYSATIPAGLSAGTHKLTATGPMPGGTRELSAELVVSGSSGGYVRADDGGATMPVTGAPIAGLVIGALAIGGVGTALVVASRRRSG
ncbi:Ig-like domain-containing protein [Longispora albida]|uniref:Ig-like domain-containing protein n=1 Tax=Longispora albida TaxID=203523 RepID=UPI0003671D3D|nr:Ig-like domain-containing protein [Longispora albida]